MPESCTHLYVHFVWATWDRLPLLTPVIESSVHACIAGECRELKCQVLAVNGIEDHVHLLARLHAAVSTAELAKQVKGASSHLVTHVVDPDQGFKWQGSYGAFSVSETDVPRVRRYIENQKAHHASGTTVPEWERCSET
jgi:REP element-mobilizing transposase RayT